MKRTIYILALVLISFLSSLNAQQSLNNLPANTILKPYKLEVGYYSTTVLLFPSAVLVADRGFNEIIAAREKDLANVLKIKAARKNFDPTNLHVFTADGKIYPFEISFSEHPSAFTFNLAKLNAPDSASINGSDIIFSGDRISDTELQNELDKIKSVRPFVGKSFHKYEMKLKLRSIHVAGDRLFFGFEIANKSSMAYDINFIRTYIQDQQKTKRSSFQEQEVIPLFKDSLQMVAGKTKSNFVIVLPKFTLSDNKRFLIEIFEKNGERNLSLKIKSRKLLRARNL
jgi:conjugative transposon TraN protein